jgi:hypothetical protein
MEATGGRGGISPTHLRPLHQMGVSSQRHAPGIWPPVPIVQEAGWAPEPVWTHRLEENFFRLCWGSNLDRQIVQPVTKHYTD